MVVITAPDKQRNGRVPEKPAIIWRRAWISFARQWAIGPCVMCAPATNLTKPRVSAIETFLLILDVVVDIRIFVIQWHSWVNRAYAVRHDQRRANGMPVGAAGARQPESSCVDWIHPLDLTQSHGKGQNGEQVFTL